MMSGIEDLFDDSISNADYEKMAQEFGFDIRDLAKEMEGYQPTMNVNFATSDANAISPSYAYPTDSGFDLYSTQEIIVRPLDRALVPTGLHIDIPDGYEIQVRSKSGLALNQGLMVLNSPGTVDCFSEDMKILTTSGEKKINEIKIGEVVYSFNEETQSIEKDIITQIFDTESQEILVIETEMGILEVTPNSEVYTTRGLILAKNLNENDEIINFF